MLYLCEFCMPIRRFDSREDYGAHINSHHKYGCWDCNIDCANKESRDAHIKQIHQWHPCTVCFQRFITAAELAHHNASPNETPSLACKICNDSIIIIESNDLFWLHCESFHANQCPLGNLSCTTFNNKQELEDHLRFKHHLFPCRKCHMVFRRHNDWRCHSANHCSMCRKVLASLSEKVAHMNEAHPGAACSQCQEFFATDLEFQHHFNDVHRFQCGLCGTSFPTIDAKEEHVNVTHRFSCPVCLVEVFTSEFLLQHHYNEVHRIGCGHCTMTFANAEAKEQHVDLVHRVLCLFCREYFAREMVQVHVEAAHKVRCVICGLGFTLEAERDEHMIAAHRSDIVTEPLIQKRMWKK